MSNEHSNPIALLLHDERPSTDVQRLESMLDFFSIPWRLLTINEVREGGLAHLVANRSHYRLLASAQALAQVQQMQNGPSLKELCAVAESVFVYGFQANDPCRKLLRELVADPQADIRRLESRPIRVTVCDDFTQMCGPMSGLDIELGAGAADSALVLSSGRNGCQRLVSAREGQLFAGVHYGGSKVFVDPSQTIADIQQRSARHFDVKRTFSGAVPVVMYLKWAFREIWWSAEEINACLIVDDPMLNAKHGHVEYRELARLLDRHGIAATFGSIPGNWRRTQDETTEMARNNSEKLSVCLHGCDRNQGDFANRSTGLLDERVRTAKQRMRGVLSRTGIHYDDIQVFPQGKFSPDLGAVLRGNGLAAAVNTEPAPHDPCRNATTIADLWSVANLRYGGFPIFTRRDIGSGVENFAFDGLLGKPCLIAARHEMFANGAKELIEFVNKLKSLEWKLMWRPLGSAIGHSYSCQGESGARVKMFANRLVLENTSHAPRVFTVVKPEQNIADFNGVRAGRRLVNYRYAKGLIHFQVTVAANSSTEIACQYLPKELSGRAAEPFTYKVMVALERHFTTFRYAYSSRKEALGRAAIAALSVRGEISPEPKSQPVR